MHLIHEQVHALIERRIDIHAVSYGLPPKNLFASARRLRHNSDQIQQETEPSCLPLIDNNYIATILTVPNLSDQHWKGF